MDIRNAMYACQMRLEKNSAAGGTENLIVGLVAFLLPITKFVG